MQNNCYQQRCVSHLKININLDKNCPTICLQITILSQTFASIWKYASTCMAYICFFPIMINLMEIDKRKGACLITKIIKLFSNGIDYMSNQYDMSIGLLDIYQLACCMALSWTSLIA